MLLTKPSNKQQTNIKQKKKRNTRKEEEEEEEEDSSRKILPHVERILNSWISTQFYYDPLKVFVLALAPSLWKSTFFSFLWNSNYFTLEFQPTIYWLTLLELLRGISHF